MSSRTQPVAADHAARIGLVVRWCRAQMVLWSPQGMDAPQIARSAFTSEDRARAVRHNFNEHGFDSLVPAYRRPASDLQPSPSREIKKIVRSRPQDHQLLFSTWSLSKLAEFLVPEGVVDDRATRVSGLGSARRACSHLQH